MIARQEEGGSARHRQTPFALIKKQSFKYISDCKKHRIYLNSWPKILNIPLVE